MTLQIFKSELFFRICGIIILGILFFIFRIEKEFTPQQLIFVLLFSILECALYWNGTKFISEKLAIIWNPFKNTTLFIIIMFLSIGLYVVILTLSSEYIHTKYFLQKAMINKDQISNLLMSLLITFFITTVYIATYFFNEWQQNLVKAEKLEKANLEARFETLKNQLNPHFLFNSLNTLLVMVADNPKASVYVENLSDIMRYLLQSVGKEAVLIRDELKIAQQYLYVQQCRFGEKLKATFQIPETIYHYAIPPMTLQMLIENAIKHNVVSQNNPLEISVYTEDKKYLVVENPLRPKIDNEKSTGIGLQNIKTRFMILSGKEVIVIKENDKFTVKLPLFEVS
jgi:sensor histidine kinase YesM